MGSDEFAVDVDFGDFAHGVVPFLTPIIWHAAIDLIRWPVTHRLIRNGGQ